MVSTRGARYKFAEGERVLCYEPDPTKAKVLYDSKVLEVIESKDRRGRRSVEYLIHFQGWNSSWDRCVSEDFVLKDTEENRQLQRDLAEKSQLQLGAYLYRRERKKGSTSSTGGGVSAPGGASATGPLPAKRARHSGNFEDEGSSSSTQHDDAEAEDETMDTSSDASAAGSRAASRAGSRAGSGAGSQAGSGAGSVAGSAAGSAPGSGPGSAEGSAEGSGPGSAEGSAEGSGAGSGEGSAAGSGAGSGAASGAVVRAVERAVEPPQHPHSRAHIVLPSALRDRLTFDYHLVVKRGRLSSLPASPCVAEILESFVRWFARAGAWSTPGRSPRSPRAPSAPPAQRPHLMDVSRRLNLVREVADGLRVYFDCVLSGHLLYKQELNQYHQLIGAFMSSPELLIKTEMEEPADEGGEDGSESGAEEAAADEAGPEEAGGAKEGSPDGVISPKLEPEDEAIEEEATPAWSAGEEVEDTPAEIKQEAAAEVKAEGTEVEAEGAEVEVQVEIKEEAVSEAAAPAEAEAVVARHRCKLEVSEDSVARRLRSHKNSTTSMGEGSGSGAGDEPCASTSQDPEPAQPEVRAPSVGSGSSSLGESWWCRRASRRSVSRPIDPPPPGRNALSTLLDKVAKWKIVPREDTEHLPCRIYGAIHLSRLFVKLPDFLNAVNMSNAKLKLLLQYIHMFVQYLDEHSEWFGESYYMADSAARSH